MIDDPGPAVPDPVSCDVDALHPTLPSETPDLPAFGDPGGQFLVDITDRDAMRAALDGSRDDS